MPTSKYRQNIKPQLVRLIIVSIIGVCIGYYLFTILENQQNRVVKGTICLVIDDFGFSQKKDVQDFSKINDNIIAAIIVGSYRKSCYNKIQSE